MPDAGSLIATFTAGVLSFCAPCTVPLLPAYLSYISGVSAVDLADEARRRQYRGRLVAGTLLFVLGFGTVFVLLGVGAGGLGRSVQHAARPIELVGGALMIVFGLVVAGVLHLRWLQRERRFEPPVRIRRLGLYAALPLGVVFGVGWTPCVGPYLASALTLAAVGAHAGTGALLLSVYALGLGTPFLLASLLCASLPDITRIASRVARPLARVGGVAMAGLGVLLVSGQYAHLTSVLAHLYTPAR